MTTRACRRTRREVVCHHCGKIVVRDPNQINRARFIFCSPLCKQSNPDFATFAAHRNGDVQRGRGEGRTYIKLNGRHMHRVVAEQKLGRALVAGEIVHHIDGNKRNNAPENLQVMTQSEHTRLHFSEMMGARMQKAGY